MTTAGVMDLHCDATKDTLLAILQESVRCSRIGNTLMLDTPYVFGDGHQLRAYLSEVPNGIMVSDGGFAAQQIEMYSPIGTNGQSYRSLRSAAVAHDLVWEGQLYFVEPTLEDALYNLHRLTSALHDTENALMRQRRRGFGTAATLKAGLESTYHLDTKIDYPIYLPENREPVVVDLFTQHESGRAVVEIIEARSESGVNEQVNRSLVNFMSLDRGEFEGIRISVVNNDVLNVDHRAVDRLNYAKPKNVYVFDDSTALAGIGELLHVR